MVVRIVVEWVAYEEKTGVGRFLFLSFFDLWAGEVVWGEGVRLLPVCFTYGFRCVGTQVVVWRWVE